MTDTELLTIDAAAKFIPNADADTLKRMARAGKLTVYRPGKSFLTTRADVMKAVEQCRVVPKVRDSGCAPHVETTPGPLPISQPGLSSTELANSALDSVLMQAMAKRKRR